MKNKKTDFFIATGGTGGHISPAISIAVELISDGKSISITTNVSLDHYLNGVINADIIKMNMASPYGNYFRKIYALSTIYWSIMKSVQIMISRSPKVIISFGGYPSFPVLIAAIIFRKKIIIHEQNSVIGRVNKFFSRFAKKVLLSYPNTKSLDEKHKSKYEYIGNLVRFLPVEFHYPDFKDELNIFIIGGSQGAEIFGDIIPEAIRILTSYLSLKINIAQQVRKEQIERIQCEYQGVDNINVEIKSFFDDIEEQIKKSHIIICRAGASTISEICHIGRPAICIPHPHVKDNHQYNNAKHLSDNNAGILIEQKDFNPENLSRTLSDLISDKNKLREIAQAAYSLFPRNSLEKFIENIS